MSNIPIPAVILLLVGLQIPSRTATAVERVALLTNGNVLIGEIRQLAEVVIIKTKNSEVRLAANEVEMVRRDLKDVYQSKAAKLSRNASTGRASLVRWCLRHGLRHEAGQELDRLEHFHPRYPGIATLRKQIQRGATKKTLLPVRSPLHRDTQFAKQQLDVLSKRTVSEFVRTVQPLLTNRCALAGCHGKGARSPYTLLSSAQSRVPQSLTYRNLGATLRQIGNYPTEQTLLWMSARTPHGGAKGATLNKREKAKVFAWIERVRANHGISTPFPVATTASTAFAPHDDPFDPSTFNELTAAELEQLELVAPPANTDKDSSTP